MTLWSRRWNTQKTQIHRQTQISVTCSGSTSLVNSSTLSFSSLLLSHIWLFPFMTRYNTCNYSLIQCHNLHRLGHMTFLEIDNEIISLVILPLPLIQEGQLSVTSKSMCTSSGPSCSKLTTLLVNDSLKFTSNDT